MKNRITFLIIIYCLMLSGAVNGADAPFADAPFEDEPEAHVLYDLMVKTMQDAKSLSWVSDYRWTSKKRELGHATYRIWLKKPNYARVEATPTRTNKVSGILVGDGDYFWIHWPDGRPRYGWEYEGDYAREYEKHCMISYTKERTPLGMHSIGHKTGDLGAGMSMTVIDPSTFHGYTDSLQPYLDGVRGKGTEKVGKEKFHVIEVSFMKYQRSWTLWLSQKDHLPRKLEQVVRVSHDIITTELWSDVKFNHKIPGSLFRWKPKKGWQEWVMPPIEEGLLEPGTKAPEFKGRTTDGRKVKLSSFRGSVVWLYKWRCG